MYVFMYVCMFYNMQVVATSDSRSSSHSGSVGNKSSTTSVTANANGSAVNNDGQFAL